MKEYYEIMVHNKGVELLVIFIVLDVIFGVLRAIKEGKLNSAIGIDGIIRKVGMIITICFCILVDTIVSVDLIGFIPENVKNDLKYMDTHTWEDKKSFAEWAKTTTNASIIFAAYGQDYWAEGWLEDKVRKIRIENLAKYIGVEEDV